ncbi:glycosyl hydrolase family 7-domain-containing protein [Mucidula mucida]|nr:glycosyl hydrolase family 7-domain-containing protein [Mucidula mucida]
MVTNYFNPIELLRPTWSFVAQVFVSNISEILIQLVFVKRIWTLLITRGKTLAVMVCSTIIVLSLISFSCGFAFAIQSLTSTDLDFSKVDQNSATLYISFGGEVLADIAIASTLCTVLYKSRTSFASTKNVINYLIVYAINTCLLTTVCAVACFITFTIWPDKFIYIAVYFSLNKLYFNSLLANLNSREHLRQKFNTEPISMSDLPKQPTRPSAEPVNTEIIFADKNQKNIGSRVYLMQDQDNYQMFSLKNQEFTFDVDVSQLPCGLNGAVYFVSMDKDGGKSKYSTNKAGARYGTGYCDSQCPHDIKFINGQCRGWSASPNDTNAGSGTYGSCCDEMDIWEANSISSAYTPHVCTSTGQTRCSGYDCGDGDNRYGGICDKDGCDFNSFRQGVKDFYGPGMTFITADGSANGALSEIRRFYVQNGKVIPNSFSTFTGLTSYNSVTDSYCNAQKSLFGDTNSFEQRGGLNKMGQALQNGMALVLSLWDDHAVNMLWLDSNYPTDADASQPGIARGT